MSTWKLRPFRGGEASPAPIPGPPGEKGDTGPQGPIGYNITYSSFTGQNLGDIADHSVSAVIANDTHEFSFSFTHKLKSGKCEILAITLDALSLNGECQVDISIGTMLLSSAVVFADQRMCIPASKLNETWYDESITIKLTGLNSVDIPAQTVTAHVTGISSPVAAVYNPLMTIQNDIIETIDGQELLAVKPA